MNELPKRMPNRLNNYDYSQNGAYFITICTKDKHELFGKIVGDAVHSVPQKDTYPMQKRYAVDSVPYNKI